MDYRIHLRDDLRFNYVDPQRKLDLRNGFYSLGTLNLVLFLTYSWLGNDSYLNIDSGSLYLSSYSFILYLENSFSVDKLNIFKQFSERTPVKSRTRIWWLGKQSNTVLYTCHQVFRDSVDLSTFTVHFLNYDENSESK